MLGAIRGNNLFFIGPNLSVQLEYALSGKKGMPYQLPDASSETGWSALHVAGMYNSALVAAIGVENKADIFLAVNPNPQLRFLSFLFDLVPRMRHECLNSKPEQN